MTILVDKINEIVIKFDKYKTDIEDNKKEINSNADMNNIKNLITNMKNKLEAIYKKIETLKITSNNFKEPNINKINVNASITKALEEYNKISNLLEKLDIQNL